jgi:hypothetical protein
MPTVSRRGLLRLVRRPLRAQSIASSHDAPVQKSPEVVVVLGEGAGVTHLRTAVRDPLVGGRLHGVLWPCRVRADAVAVPDALHAEVEAPVRVGRLRRFIGVVDRLVHVPEVGHVERHGRGHHGAEQQEGESGGQRLVRALHGEGSVIGKTLYLDSTDGAELCRGKRMTNDECPMP